MENPKSQDIVFQFNECIYLSRKVAKQPAANINERLSNRALQLWVKYSNGASHPAVSLLV